MNTKILQEIVPGVVLMLWLFFPEQLAAQSALVIKPSAEITRIYDDNLFFTASSAEKDSFLRISPMITLGYSSSSTRFQAKYAFDAERYNEHPELDSDVASKRTELEFYNKYSRSTSFQAIVDYTNTRTPGDLSPEVGLNLGRTQAQRISFSPSMGYIFDHLNTGTMTYSFGRDKFVSDTSVSDETNDTYSADFELDRRVSHHDTNRFSFRFDRFDFEAGDAVTAYTILGGRTHELTPRTSITVVGGPRFSNGAVDLEVSASLDHKFERGGIVLDYTRRETTLLGLTDTASAQSVGARINFPLASASDFRLEPRYFVTEQGGGQTDVFILNIGAGYKISRYLTVNGTYEFSSQHGSLTRTDDGDITRNVVFLSFVLAAPERPAAEERSDSTM